MTSGVFFALLSLLAAGFSDVVFKKYCGKERSRGMYICGIGIIWTMLQLTMFVVNDQAIILNEATLYYGIAAGIAVALANILLLESLTHLDVSLGSTIYRLNTIGVVVFSFIFLSESLGWMKGAGVLCGVIGVLILYKRNKHVSLDEAASMARVFLVVAMLAAIVRASYGVISKAGISEGAQPATMMLISSICWIIGGFLYALIREKRVRISLDKLRYSALSGVLIFMIVNFLIAALERGEASVLVPIANMSFIVAMAVSVMMKMEHITKRKLAAVGCAAFSIFLLAQSGV
ncbi:EamA family transporter [Amphritea sp.]|uniref:EamA family transporter n=1 Tax=Amphritea sp. TaxID=1872502 RepID=UPI003A946740